MSFSSKDHADYRMPLIGTALTHCKECNALTSNWKTKLCKKHRNPKEDKPHD